MDLIDADSVRSAVRSIRPRWIVNPAAYTAVDRAESEPEAAHRINTAAVAVMAEEALALDAGLLHFSTDYVFDGTKADPYTESDGTGPVSVYGKTKLAGEQALQQSGAAYSIFRTSWVYGTTGKNFLLTILKLARERETLRIVADQRGSPTWSRDLARLAAHMIAECEKKSVGGNLQDSLSEIGGLYHASGSGYATWFDFATEIVAKAQLREPSTQFANIEPITTAEFPTPAKRPANSRLSCQRLEQRLSWTMMDWRASLDEVMVEL